MCPTAKEAQIFILCIPSFYLASLGFGGNMLNTESLDMTWFDAEASRFEQDAEGRGPVDGARWRQQSCLFNNMHRRPCIKDVSGEMDMWDLWRGPVGA